MTPNRLIELFVEAGAPPGVVQLVHGGKEQVDAPAGPPGRAGRVVRRFGARGAVRLPHGDGEPEAGAGHGRRQEPPGRHAGRGPGPGHLEPGGRLLRGGRTALHGHQRGGVRGPERGVAAGAARRHGGGPAGRVGRRRRRVRAADHAAGPGAHPRLHRPRPGRGGFAAARRLRLHGGRVPARQLGRPDPVRRRHPGHVHLPRRDLRPGAGDVRGRHARRGDPLRQRQSLRERHVHLHGQRSRRAPLPARDRRGPGRHQRPHPGAVAVLLVHRVEAVLLRGPARLRQAGGEVLHGDEDGDRPLVPGRAPRRAPR